MAKAPTPALIADIGGTNARFALAEPGAAGTALRSERIYRAADFPHLEDALAAFISEAGLASAPEAAALAVASPVRGDRIELTNRAWSFSCSELRERFGFRRLRVLNDFAAVAHALPFLGPGDLRRIGAPQTEGRETEGVLAVIGPGTGLGVAALAHTAAGPRVIDSEGGHMSFAPADKVETAILRILQARFGHVSFERLLSGPGLVNLHRALAEIENVDWDGPDDPADIVRRGVAGADRHCAATLQRYCAILGGFAGDAALMFGARHLFVGGGIVPRFADYLAQSEFRARFEAKGRFAGLLRSVPADVIVRSQPGLLGAAMALQAEPEDRHGDLGEARQS